jgi:hypothetical protein
MDRDEMAIDLDKALHHLLSRQNFTGPGHIRVSVSRDTTPPTYVAVIDSDAARVIAEFLPSALNLQVEPDPVMWAFDPDNAAAIIATAMR